MPLWLQFLGWLALSIVCGLFIVKIIGSLFKGNHSKVVFGSCAVIILASVAAIFGMEIPKGFTLGITLFSYFWGLNELTSHTNLDQMKKNILRNSLAITGIILLFIVLWAALEFNIDFENVNTSVIETIGFGVLILTIAMQEKDKPKEREK